LDREPTESPTAHAALERGTATNGRALVGPGAELRADQSGDSGGRPVSRAGPRQAPQHAGMNAAPLVIFVHSLFRAASTYFYQALKRVGPFHVYHEPLHEVIATLPSGWEQVLLRRDELKEHLRHPFLQGGYFDEFLHLLPAIRETFDPKFSFDQYFLDARSDAAPLRAYIDTLIQGAQGLPVLQCTRMAGRMAWLQAQYASRQVFLLRNPWDQWYSYKVDDYISVTPRLIFSQADLPPVLRDILAAREASSLAGADLQAKLEYAYTHPIAAEVDYFLFFGLWTYALLAGRRHCDLIVDVDELCSAHSYRTKVVAELRAIGLPEVELDDVDLHRAAYQQRERPFFELAEQQVLEIFRRHGALTPDLEYIGDYLKRRRATAFLPALGASARRVPALEDAARMRAVVRARDARAASIVARYERIIGEQGSQMATQAASLREHDDRLDERERRIESLQASLDAAGREVERLKELSSVNDANLQALQRINAEREDWKAQLSQALRAGEAEIARLRLAERESSQENIRLAERLAEREHRLGEQGRALATRAEELARVVAALEKAGREAMAAHRATAESVAREENLRGALAERQTRITLLDQRLAAADARIDALVRAESTRGDAFDQLARRLDEGRERIGRLEATLAARDEQLESLRLAGISADERIARLDREAADLKEQAASRVDETRRLRQVLDDRENTIQALRSSRSWRLTAPVRAVGSVVHSMKQRLRTHAVHGTAPPRGADAYFTICAKNFLAHARTLHASIQPHYPDARFFVVLCDRVDGRFDPTQEPFEFLYLEDLGLPNMDEMAARYSITEFNTAVKPFAFMHLMAKRGYSSIVYLDPDLLFVDRMVELDAMLQEGAEAVLTPHILRPAENDELHDGKMLVYGVYNLGFLALRDTAGVRNFLAWWGRRLERQCVIRLEEGLFVDQKWADLLPAFVSGTRILHHPGYNVAYWNLPQRRITRIEGKWYANDVPMRFVHFSGNRLDDPNTFSRHSQQVTVENIGVLRELLEAYRSQVYAQGHAFYRTLPYAFSWSGESGFNVHTPKEFDQSAASGSSPAPIAAPPRMAQLSVPTVQGRVRRRVAMLRRALPVARALCGGWLPFAGRAWRAYRRQGWNHVKAKAVELSRYGETASRPATAPTVQDSRKRLLYIDWATPKPDRDAGSLLAVNMMEIFDSLGYRVTFLPCSLQYEAGYNEALVAAKIEVLGYPAVTSVKDWLEAHAREFHVCVMSRGPVVWPYLDLLRRAAPDLRLVFNTVDLHYVRELRQAQLHEDAEALKAAELTRAHEFDLMRRSHVTILLSSQELYTVRAIEPDAALAVVPMVFHDMPGAQKGHADRRDILFVGGFLHQPNVDAVLYFCEQVFPLIRRRLPDVRFKVIGSEPPDAIQRLARQDGVDILGFVKELEPVFSAVRISVAPLRFGAGIKGKIASSLCYGVPCVATSVAIEGMGLDPGMNVLVGDAPDEIAEQVCRVYQSAQLWEQLSREGHRFAVENYSFKVIRERVRSLLVSVCEGWAPIQSAVELDSLAAYKNHRDQMGDEYARRSARETSLVSAATAEAIATPGFCYLCGRQTRFITSRIALRRPPAPAAGLSGWRDQMICEHCGLGASARAVLHALMTLAPPERDGRILVTEHGGPIHTWFAARFAKVTGMPLIGADGSAGQSGIASAGSIPTPPSIEDAQFDRIYSCDSAVVAAHPGSLLQKMYRTLDCEGVLLFCLPLAEEPWPDSGLEGADRPDRGGATSPNETSLTAPALLGHLKSAGFRCVRALAYWSESQGYLGREQFLFIARK